MQIIINKCFLATGNLYTGLEARFRMSRPSIHDVINDTCDAIWEVLAHEYIFGNVLKKASAIVGNSLTA